jgi:FkbM family methyltransferase
MQKEGFKTWHVLRKLNRLNTDTGSCQAVQFKNLAHPIFLRPGTRDAHTIMNNIIREEYGQIKAKKESRWMIDGGAYIGDTAAYFLSNYPGLTVIALEPGEESHSKAARNLKDYGSRAILLKKGLYSADQVCRFDGNDTGAGISGSGYEIKCISLPTLIKNYSIPRIDILKMDIEGAEEQVFLENPGSWLRLTDLLLIEIHNPHILEMISRVLRENNFIMRQHRTVWYCWPDISQTAKGVC